MSAKQEFVYETRFELEAFVTSLDDANDYLHEDNMRNYLYSDQDLRDFADHILEITWTLKNHFQGVIRVVADRLLTDEESEKLSEWISGQCSDGLGEGFEQQDFANYLDEESMKMAGYDPDDDDIDEDEFYVMASFDWKKNHYMLELVK